MALFVIAVCYDLCTTFRTILKIMAFVHKDAVNTRLVHTAAADLYYRFVADCMGKFGYSRVAVLAGGNSSQSLQTLRTKYPKLFLLVDDVDYPGCNAKHCSYAFDQFGHGSAACVGPTITCAWKTAETDGSDFAVQAVAAAERMKKNLTRYIIIM